MPDLLQVGPPDVELPVPVVGPQPLALTFSSQFLDESETGSAAWYLKRMLLRLDARTEMMRRWDAYYRGDQPLAFASEKFRESFGGRFRAFSSNFCSLVVDGTRERMEVTGFTFSSRRASQRAWRIWQENDMDGWSQIAHTEALIKGVCYALVEPALGRLPRITIEDPLDSIVDVDQRTRERRAGLKRWRDDDGHLVVYVYLPDFIYKLRSQSPWTTLATVHLEPFPQDGEPWPVQNPLGVVPLVALPNRPRLHGEGQSEIDPVMSNQDAVNKYRADALVAAEFAAFRQRWAIGIDIPQDPVTGQPVEPFKAAVDRLWVVPPPSPDDPNPPEARFGEFSQTDLAPYQQMIESEVGAISSISRLPYHYLLGQPQAVPPSGESLKSSEAGLISKVKTALIHFGLGWEETLRLALVADGDAPSERTAVTQWRNPETLNEGVHTDAVVKKHGAGIIDTNEARVELGYAPVDMAVAPPADVTPSDEAPVA